jgi:hypothetical protein
LLLLLHRIGSMARLMQRSAFALMTDRGIMTIARRLILFHFFGLFFVHSRPRSGGALHVSRHGGNRYSQFGFLGLISNADFRNHFFSGFATLLHISSPHWTLLAHRRLRYGSHIRLMMRIFWLANYSRGFAKQLGFPHFAYSRSIHRQPTNNLKEGRKFNIIDFECEKEEIPGNLPAGLPAVPCGTEPSTHALDF